MKELQAKAKVTQTMTRDGLVVENQADGTVENISSREAEQDYSTDAEGKAEKILERAEDIKDGHKNKKKAKKAAETAATAKSEDGLHRSAARLELTEEERADPALQPYIQKAEVKADKLDAARAALPKKRVPVKEKVYDAANGKYKTVPVRLALKALPKSVNLGSFETGSTTDSETELEVSYLNLYVDGKSVMEIDKFNYVCKIGDEDMLETVRKDLGLA